MNHNGIERYRSSCILVANGRGRGSHHHQIGRPFLENRGPRSQGGWQYPSRIRQPMSNICHFDVPTHSMGFIYEGTTTLPGPIYSFPSIRRGPVGPRGHSPLSTVPHCPPYLSRSTNPHSRNEVTSCLCTPHPNVVTSCSFPANGTKSWQVQTQPLSKETSLHSTTKDEIEQLPMSRLALHADKKEDSLPELSINRDDEREDSLSPPSSSDTVSVTSDEGSSGVPEAILPRIIKPRKRRKKDRKPVTPPSSTSSGSPELSILSNNATYLTSSLVHSDDHSRTLLTLKPYIPMCYQAEGGHPSPPCCSQCSSPLLFPTPPPSPAASVATSSSCSEDETVWPPVAAMGAAEKGILVRSYSAPHPPPPSTPFVSRIRISSTVTHSFNGHREIDLRLFSVEPTQSIAIPPPIPPRLRHFSTPCPTRRKVQAIEYAPTIASPRKYIPESYWRDIQEHAVRTPPPTEREWVSLAEPNNSISTCIFTVLCYNVLCDKYATRQMYGYCPPWALEWTYRKKGIMDEVRRCSADIITLQEVETDQFFNFFLPELKKENYDGIFSPKSRAKHMSESERKYVDGCAIFWRTTKFTLIEEHLIEFNQLAMANHDGSEDMLNRVMTKDNIGLAALLHTTEHAWGSILPDKSEICQPILVCTAHIHWDPEFCDVKLIQTIMLMSEIRGIVSQIIDDTRRRGGPKLDITDIHLMLCGDLNSLPESGVIEFLTKGSVSMDHDDFKGLGYKMPLQKIALSKNHNSGLVNTATNSYTHSFRLAATYENSIMAYTNYTYDFKGIIDYIFHSYSSIRTLGVLGPIDPDWFIENKVVGCPHPHVPSDHFPLLVELELSIPNALPQPNGMLHR